MNIEDHREEATDLAKRFRENPNTRINYDHEAVSLIALAVETNDPDLTDAVASDTNGWLESDDEKGARQYLIHVISEHLSSHD